MLRYTDADGSLAMQRLKVGQRICKNRFEIVSLLGVGGSGEVYLARDTQLESLDNQVALKIFSEISQNEAPILELHARIKHEAEALAKIDHPSVVKALELLVEDEMHLLVQEYLPGGSLHDAIRLQHNDYRDPQNWLRLAVALAEGLEALHASGLVHGDIKPGNIGFRDLGHNQPVFVDFGQAALINSSDFLSRPAHALATLPYLAPERSGFI
ncbi:MAG: serine/threonine protein kinase, partial [Betaproteobacteria bacterium]|nr:serine/threonine protein kinase [Betaproteobacteria bacterium]